MGSIASGQFQQPSDVIGEYTPRTKERPALLDNGECYVNYTFDEWMEMRRKKRMWKERRNHKHKEL